MGGAVTVRNRLEGLVFLVAHEARHATDENAQIRRDRGHASMENDCNRHGERLVEKFRVAWPKTLRAQVAKEIRLDRERAKRAKAQRASAKSPEMKLRRAQANLSAWEAKAKRAANAMKKYRRQVRYYQGRVAAKGDK